MSNPTGESSYKVSVVELSDSMFCYGIEIEPPLHELAAQGLAKALTGPLSHMVPEAEVTRQDDAGTALAISANRYVNTSQKVGEIIASLIDPTKSRGVEIVAIEKPPRQI